MHSREAAQDTFDLIKREHAGTTGGVIHCFSGSKEMAKEIVRNDALDRVYMALDYFDASFNRVLALATGFRSWQKALLTALCTPNEMLKELQDTNQLGKLMVMHEAVKMLPIGEIWEEYCRREGVCDDLHFYDEIERYEREVLTKRG